MKKTVLTLGLFSLMMILTSFTSPEIGGTQSAPRKFAKQNDNLTLEIGGTQSAPRRIFEIGGTQSAPRKIFEIGGTQSAPRGPKR